MHLFPAILVMHGFGLQVKLTNIVDYDRQIKTVISHRTSLEREREREQARVSHCIG